MQHICEHLFTCYPAQSYSANGRHNAHREGADSHHFKRTNTGTNLSTLTKSTKRQNSIELSKRNSTRNRVKPHELETWGEAVDTVGCTWHVFVCCHSTGSVRRTTCATSSPGIAWTGTAWHQLACPEVINIFPRSCRPAKACAVVLPEVVATSLPGLSPPRLDMNGAACLP